MLYFGVSRRVHFVWADLLSNNIPLVDLLSFEKQIYQGSIPDLSSLFTDKSRNSSYCFVVPHEAKFWTRTYTNYVNDLSRYYRIIYFNRGDFPRKLTISNSFELVNSKQVGTRKKSIIIPYNVISLDDLDVREYTLKPTISFVGYIPKFTIGRIVPRTIGGAFHPIKNNGVLIRRSGIRSMRRSAMKKSFNIDIQIRNHYGGAISQVDNHSAFRAEFIDSMRNSDFVYSPRGDGNASQRFYEAISAGRIPIIPDSSVVLPRIVMNSWNNLIFKVGALSLNMKEVVSKNWSLLDDSSYMHRQENLRDLYRKELDYRTFIFNLFSKNNFHFHLK